MLFAVDLKFREKSVETLVSGRLRALHEHVYEFSFIIYNIESIVNFKEDTTYL